MKEMISAEEAREIVISNTSQGSIETVDLGSAAGRVIREHIVALENIPPFDNSAMDGYAVASGDFSRPPVELRIIEDVPAGSTPRMDVTAGTCSRIMTGAPLPVGADAVAPVEWTPGFRSVGETISIDRAPISGQHVRRAGDDVSVGTTVFESGTLINATMVGTLASLGYDNLSVTTRPTVSILATGSELVPPGKPLESGQIRNSNGPGLAALVRSAGAQVLLEDLARDDYKETLSALKAASEADIVLVSGGVSVGSHDFVKDALNELGVELLFWRVRQRPGKPLVFGLVGDTLIFGLPGNPVSSTVCFYQYVYPAIAKILGIKTERQIRRARLGSPVTKAGGLHYFIAGHSWTDDAGHLHVQRSGPQGSHVYSSMATADCIIHLDESLDASPSRGSLVDIELLPC